jgi:tRNA(Ile)-lysidine synthase
VARLRRLRRRPIVALSGGADSLALLVLAVDAERDPVAVHVHHGLGPHADPMAAHCAELCAELGVPLRIERIEPGPLRADRRGLEAAARDARYRVLAPYGGDGVILTGHTADDRLETLLLRLAQGAGLGALAGPRRAVRIAGAAVRRPLLRLWRRDTEVICTRAALTPFADPMNDDPAFLRVRARNDVVPALKALGGDAALARSLAQLAEDADALDHAAAGWLAAVLVPGDDGSTLLDRAALRGMPAPVRRAAIRGALVARVVRPSRALVAMIERIAVRPGPGRADGPDLVATASGAVVRLARRSRG